MNNKKKEDCIRLLFLHAKVGQGHTQVALSLAETALEKSSVPVLVSVFDTLNLAHPLSSKITKLLYIGTIKYLPTLWISLYKSRSIIMHYNHFIARILMRWALYRHLSQIIREHKPDSIICTHFFPIPPLAHLKNRYSPFKLYAVVTDGDLHPLWTYKGVDTYFVADEKSVGRYTEKDLKAKIYPIGMPIDLSFNQEPKENVKDIIGISNRFTVMITGGGEGIGPITEIAKIIDSSISNINIMIICGRNEKLRKKLINTSFRNNAYIYGYIENIIDYYDSADCVLGKPGGITTAEVFARGKPFIAYLAYGGQEEGNIRRFIGRDGFYICKKISEIPEIINKLIKSDKYRNLSKKLIENSDRGISTKMIKTILNDIIEGYGLL
ncbi:MAG: MGDG synthase family glycosyltransferase [bacterium]